MAGSVRSNPLLAVIDEMLRLESRIEQLFAEVAGGSSLSTLQKMVLFSIYDSPVPLTVPQVGRHLGHHRQVIQRIANELVEAGLLERASNPHHKSAKLLVPTPKADEMKRQAEARALEIAEGFLGSVSAQRCVDLVQELGALREAIEAHMRGEDSESKWELDVSQQAKGPLALLARLN